MSTNPTELEDSYNEFTKNFQKYMPDGIISVDLQLLSNMGLLNNAELEQPAPDNLAHYFHVVETPDKVTLFNEQFAVWIVPQMIDNVSTTMTFIALMQQQKPHLEIVFSTTGVYNTPKYILKILQHFLTEVQDTEAIITSIDKKK